MRKRRPFVFAVITLLSVAHAFGASRTWTGGNSALWSDGGNWAGGVAPQSGDDLVFGAGASNLATVNDLAVGFPINSISITSAGYSLNGARINLGAGGISTSASGSIVIPLVLTAAQTWTSSASAVLTTNSSVNLNGQTLTLNSAGGDGNITGVISGSGTIIKIGGGGGSGTDWTLSGTNTFSGQIQINNGRLIANNASSFGVSDNTLPNGIVINGGTLVFNNFSFGAEYIQVSLGGNNGNGAFQANGTPILNGTTELGPGLFMNVLGGSNLTFAGVVTGNGTFHIAGGGIYTLANSGNNFSGGVVYTGASTITLGNDNVVPNSVSLDLPANAVFNVNTHQETITAFFGAGNVNLGSGAGGTLTLTNQTGTHTGVISGIGAIIQSSGNVTYSGVNTYTGSYTTNGGIVNVSGGALPANYTQSGGTL